VSVWLIASHGLYSSGYFLFGGPAFPRTDFKKRECPWPLSPSRMETPVLLTTARVMSRAYETRVWSLDGTAQANIMTT